MQRRIATIVAVGLIVSLTAAVQGQGPPGMPPGGMRGPGMMGGLSLALQPAVQEDLGLSTKQKDQLKKLEAAAAQRRRQMFENQGEGEDRPDPMEMMSLMIGMRREQEATIAKILDKKQEDRIAQIELRREGVLAVARKEIASKVKLTSAQSKKVKAVMEEMQKAQASAMPRPPGGGFGPGDGGPPGGGGGEGGRTRGNRDNANAGQNGAPAEGDQPANPNARGNDDGQPRRGGDRGGNRRGGPPDFNSPEARAQFAKMREVMEKTRKEAADKMNEILTDTQKAAFDKLLGKPFDVSKLRMGPPPGGPGEPGKRARGRDSNT